MLQNTKKEGCNISMNSIQKKIIEIFKEFDRICRKYKLKYYAIGGTCLGAIRHKGFIPWDDDLDVVMPIEDYFKFRNVCLNEGVLKKGYSIINPIDAKSSHCIYMKLQDNNTTFVENSEINFPEYYKGVWIDIMPLIGVPKNKLSSFIFKARLRYYWANNNNLKFDTSYKDKVNLKGKLLLLLTKCLSYKKDDNHYVKKWEKLLLKYPIKANNDLLFPWRIPARKPYKNTFPYKCFRDSVRVEFEDTTIMCPIDYDEYLRLDFGDYMQLPPKEKRISHSYCNSIIDLNKSYKMYQKEKRNIDE